MIYNEASSADIHIAKCHLHYSAKVSDSNSFLEYIAAITGFVNNIFNCNAHIDPIYCKKTGTQDEYFKIKFPLIGIIPMYIVDFYASKYSLKLPRSELALL